MVAVLSPVLSPVLSVCYWCVVVECAAAKLLCVRGILERESANFADFLSSKVLIVNDLAAAERAWGRKGAQSGR